MMTKEKQAEIEAEYSAAVRVLDEVALRRNVARQEMAMQSTGLKPGDRVLYKGTQYSIAHFDVRYDFSEPWLKAYKVLKSGVISTNLSTLYRDWTKV